MGVLIKILFVVPVLLLFLLCIPLFILNEIAAEIAQGRVAHKQIQIVERPDLIEAR